MLRAETITLPAHWASALINGDRTGLTDEDELELDDYLQANPDNAAPVSCSDYAELQHWGTCFANRVLMETLEYTYLRSDE